MDTVALAEGVAAGDPRAVARVISLLEDDDPSATDLMRRIYRQTGHAYLVGITGPPGAGKSTLVDRLVGRLREEVAWPGARGGGAPTVGVLAVDPSSPFTGGAVLGDRLRMQSRAGDDKVFIRSMATRGHLGGLSRATGEAALVLDAAGCDVVLIETVGVGQDEVDVVRMADLSIVTLVPGTGDDVQALKAGIMEIGDVFVVNKADREGADHLVAAIEGALSLGRPGAPDGWRPPVLRTVATRGTGVDDLLKAVLAFRAASGTARAGQPAGSSAERVRDLRRNEERVRNLVGRRIWARLELVLSPGELAAIVERLAARELDPYSAADELLARAGVRPVSERVAAPS